MSDRVRALPALAKYALLSGRPLAVHPEFWDSATKASPGSTVSTPWGPGPFHYWAGYAHVEDYDAAWRDVWVDCQGPHPVVVGANHFMHTWPEDGRFPELVPTLQPHVQAAVDTLVQQCSSEDQQYGCGALFLHAAIGTHPQLAHMLHQVMAAVEVHRAWASQVFGSPGAGPRPWRYPMLHMRMGSASFEVHGRGDKTAELVGVPGGDTVILSRHASALLSALHDGVTSPPYKGNLSLTPLVAASDSTRFIGELSFMAHPMQVASCCSSPLHTQRVYSHEAARLAIGQVLFDMVALAHASTVVLTRGGMGMLGTMFLSWEWHDHPGADIMRWENHKCVGEAAHFLLDSLMDR